MCGRFAVTTGPARLAAELDAIDETGVGDRPASCSAANCSAPNCSAPNCSAPNYSAPNYNVAPATDIAAVIAPEGQRRLRLMRWGLLPGWVKASPDGAPPARTPLINARAETVTTSPAFRAAAAHKRCLIPMDGYYEWQANADNPKRGRKTPYYFYRRDRKPLLVAGLWSVWRAGGYDTEQPLTTCAVITTDAVGEFARIHHRMPLVLDESEWDRWLAADAAAPQDLLVASPDIAPMAMREVGLLVNNVANNGPELIDPPRAGDQPVGLF